MSRTCNTCQSAIDWNTAKREALHIRGPLNPDGTIHRCMTSHKEQDTSASPMAQPRITKEELSQEQIMLLQRFCAALKLVGFGDQS